MFFTFASVASVLALLAIVASEPVARLRPVRNH